MPVDADQSYWKTALWLANAVREGRLREVFFSSAVRGEGTTTALLEVARHLSQHFGLRPLVIELDRTRPVCLRRFEFDPERTLNAFAAGRLPAQACIQQNGSGVVFLATAETSAPERTEWSVSALLRRVLEEVASDFDIVLIDAPPLLERPDAMAVASVVPKMVLVVEAGRTRYEVLDRIKRELAAGNVSIVGAILNKHRKFIPGWVYRWLIE